MGSRWPVSSRRRPPSTGVCPLCGPLGPGPAFLCSCVHSVLRCSAVQQNPSPSPNRPILLSLLWSQIHPPHCIIAILPPIHPSNHQFSHPPITAHNQEILGLFPLLHIHLTNALPKNPKRKKFSFSKKPIPFSYKTAQPAYSYFESPTLLLSNHVFLLLLLFQSKKQSSFLIPQKLGTSPQAEHKPPPNAQCNQRLALKPPHRHSICCSSPTTVTIDAASNHRPELLHIIIANTISHPDRRP